MKRISVLKEPTSLFGGLVWVKGRGEGNLRFGGDGAGVVDALVNNRAVLCENPVRVRVSGIVVYAVEDVVF